MTTDALAAAIVAACGTASNIERVERCFTRLRLGVRDLGAVDLNALTALSDVQLAFEQAGEIQMLITTSLSDTVAAVRARLNRFER